MRMNRIEQLLMQGLKNTSTPMNMLYERINLARQQSKQISSMLEVPLLTVLSNS